MKAGDLVKLSKWDKFYKVYSVEKDHVLIENPNGGTVSYPLAITDHTGAILPWIIRYEEVNINWVDVAELNEAEKEKDLSMVSK